MQNKAILVAVILVLALICPALADAPVPDDIQVSVANPVLVANGIDATAVSITVKNQTNPIPGLSVNFFVNDGNLGNMTPASTTTSPEGVAESTFTAKKVAGSAEVSAQVSYTIGGTEYSQTILVGQIEIQEPIPDTIEFNTTEEWLVANGADSSMAVVKVYNKTYPIPNLEVLYTVLETELGTIDPATSATNESGTAASRFTVKYKSGNATLKAFVNYRFMGNTTVVEQQCIQKIDHDTPYILSSYNAPSEMTVGATAPLIMAYEDRWGNPIDNRRIAENVTFMVSCPDRDALFLNSSYPFNVTDVPVNHAGEAIAWLRASLSPSINTVRVNPDMGSIPDKYFFIQGIANRTPTNISQEFDPAGYLNQPPKLYADGISLYAITYTVSDEFGNGVMNTPVHITTTISGEEWIVYTNSVGQAMLTYGPKTSIGKITITASAIGNTTSPPSCSKEVWFVSQEAEDMQFTAVPDSMASRDVDGWEPAMLMAKVIDENGNPVEGETVTFTLGTPVYESTPLPPLVTDPPELVNTSAVTDSDGFAIGYFNPGGFSLNWTHPSYDDTASGSCVVTAYWENVTSGKSATQNLILSWKNYPYLSIETEVFPQTVNVTGTVDVLIRLKGDGWALRPKPIDAVLCTDRSGSMLQDEPDDRMVPVLEASKAFTGAMHVSAAQDHIGLVSFGTNGWAKLSPQYRYLNGNYYCYRDGYGWSTRYLNGYFYDWTNMYGVTSNSNSISSSSFRWVYRDDYWDTPVTYNYRNYWPYTTIYDTNSNHQTYINTHYPGNNRNYGDYAVVESHLVATPALINSSIDMMVPTGGTPMRYGIYKAIQEIQANGRTKAIRAIILLSDGDYNYYGDPLARNPTLGHTSWSPTSYGDLDADWHSFSGLTTAEQNMSVFAKNNNIRIYAIGYAADISTGGRNTLRILAESTGGQYFDGDAANIDEIYETIAGQLQEEAGVDTMMDLYYDSIEVNYNITPVNETYQVFEYIPETDIDSYYSNMSRPVHSPPYPYSINQSEEYNLTQKLNFSIGTVKLGQTWEAMYTLRVLTDGNINVFGPNSKVTFNGTEGPSQMWVPKTYITGVPEMVVTGVNSSVLNITVGDSSDTGTGFVEWPIIRNYTGTMEVKEDYYISTDGGMTWILMGFSILSPEQANQNGVYRVDRNQFPPGVDLEFRVVGNALDAPGPIISNSDPSPPPPPPNRNYIVLK